MVELDELVTHSVCPEQGRRRRTDPYKGLSAAEYRYRTNLRKVLVRYYTSLLEEQPMNIAAVLRTWSYLWSDIPTVAFAASDKSFTKAHSSALNALLSDSERLCLRGSEALIKWHARVLHGSMRPVIVDEPFTMHLDGVAVTGRFPLVFEDRSKRYWIVDWSDSPRKYEFQYDVRHAVLLSALRLSYGRHASGVVVDYICTLGEVIEISKRSPAAIEDQLADAAKISKAIAGELTYKNFSACGTCPYRASCRGIQVVQQKRPTGRPRKRAADSGPA